MKAPLPNIHVSLMRHHYRSLESNIRKGLVKVTAVAFVTALLRHSSGETAREPLANLWQGSRLWVVFSIVAKWKEETTRYLRVFFHTSAHALLALLRYVYLLFPLFGLSYNPRTFSTNCASRG